MSLVNASGWPTTCIIDMKSKAALLQGLVYEEVIHKREAQQQSFRQGLDILGLLQLLQMYPDKLRPVLLPEQGPLTGAKYLALITTPHPSGETFDWFQEYIMTRPIQGN